MGRDSRAQGVWGGTADYLGGWQRVRRWGGMAAGLGEEEQTVLGGQQRAWGSDSDFCLSPLCGGCPE